MRCRLPTYLLVLAIDGEVWYPGGGVCRFVAGVRWEALDVPIDGAGRFVVGEVLKANNGVGRLWCRERLGWREHSSRRR